MHFCARFLQQIRHVAPRQTNSARGLQMFLSNVNKCSKLSAAALSQAALKKPCDNNADVTERIEVSLIKTLLAGNKHEQGKDLGLKNNVGRSSASVKKRPCASVEGQCNYRNQLVWQDILLGSKNVQKQDVVMKECSNLIGVSEEMWYCMNTDEACPKKHLKDGIVHFGQMHIIKCSTLRDTDSSASGQRAKSGPSSEQLSRVLLKLREELPNFFESHQCYSIYRKDILFVNKLTRTTTRTLTSYKHIMNVMASAGRLFWTRASLDIIRITKHHEDNTIKVRWTAKGIPWYQLPFFLLTGKQQSLFYRYVDGFSIFEVGRDGLVHCHRLDKVMPTSTPERQKWSIRMQILALLGLAEITHEPCEAFQVKSQEMLK